MVGSVFRNGEFVVDFYCDRRIVRGLMKTQTDNLFTGTSGNAAHMSVCAKQVPGLLMAAFSAAPVPFAGATRIREVSMR